MLVLGVLGSRLGDFDLFRGKFEGDLLVVAEVVKEGKEKLQNIGSL